MRSWLFTLAVACTPPAPIKPPGPVPTPTDILVEGDAAGCPAGWRRFVDRRQPTRFSLCAPRGTRVGWFSGLDEVAGTIDLAFIAADSSAQLGVSTAARMPAQGLGPYQPPTDAVIDFDRADDRFAGRAARHYRMHFHVHHERSYELDEHGNHPANDETSDHEQAVEVWAMPLGPGKLDVTLRTQENTAEATAELLRKIVETVELTPP